MPKQRPSEARKRVRAFEVRGLLRDFGDVLVERPETYTASELEDWAVAIEATLAKALTIMERRGL